MDEKDRDRMFTREFVVWPRFIFVCCKTGAALENEAENRRAHTDVEGVGDYPNNFYSHLMVIVKDYCESLG